jgi:acetoin utilization deacetylase AcuC-like enzyme
MSDSDDESGFMPPWARALHRSAAMGDLEGVREVLELLYAANAAVAKRAGGGGGGDGDDDEEEEEDAGAVFGMATTSEEEEGAPEDDGDDDDDEDDDEEGGDKKEDEEKPAAADGDADAEDPPAAKKQKTEEEEEDKEQRPPATLGDALAAAAAGKGPWPNLPLDVKDWGESTPLHAAVMGGHVQVARLLLQCGASSSLPLDGCPPLHLATCVGMQSGGLREAALEIVRMLLGGRGGRDASAAAALPAQAAADPLQRDDSGRTALHWAAEHGLEAVAEALLDKSAEAEARLRAAMAEDEAEMRAAAAAAGGGGGNGAPAAPPAVGPPTLSELVDSNGDTALHLAAKYNNLDVVKLLLSRGQAAASAAPGAAPSALLAAKNRHGFSPAHLAALHGADGAVAAALLEAAPEVVATLTDRRGLTAAAAALRRGLPDLVAPLVGGGAGAGGKRTAAPASAAPAAEAKRLLAAASKLPDRRKQQQQLSNTLIVAPPECGRHLTHPAGPRGQAVNSEPPPENPGRVEVLVDPSRGILRAEALSEKLGLQWADKPGEIAPCPMADVLRVHDWPYVRRLEAACAALPEDDDAIGRLDPDTAVSRGTFRAALMAAGAVVHAVDAVLSGSARNAFCAVRPPGHHAGPRGVVPSAVDPNGSHGFCLLNNVAVGAAYAMAVHRHRVQRVAILDFDVHHGNGTEACVVGTAPRTVRVPFSTGLSEGVQLYHTWKPWRDSDDGDNVLFISVQGVGPKAHGVDAYVYPGSGATHDSKKDGKAVKGEGEGGGEGGDAAAAAAAAKPEEANGAGPAPMDTTGGDDDEDKAKTPAIVAEEDPEGEFKGVVPPPQDAAPSDGPRVIDVGIPGPGFHPALWRRAWRDKALPALANFKPDLILVSAGFDAHRKDDINFRYIGATESDYEWLTDQIVQVANGCCSGRVVSVLEGGYNLRGRGACSAFARSVAAHVRAMAEPNFQAWDPAEGQKERETERRRREERAAKAAARAAAAEARRAAAMAAEAAALAAEAAEVAAAGAGGDGEAAAAPAAAPSGGGKRPRRGGGAPVDYAALNAKLEAEKAAAAAAGSKGA